MQVNKAGIDAGMQTQFKAGQDANSEEDLIRRALEGQSEAFSELLKPHLRSLKNMVQRLVRNDFDTEDIVQQAIMKAYTRLEQFRFQASFRTWVMSIALNEIRQNVRVRANARLVFDDGKIIQCATADRDESPHESYEREERAQTLRTAIRKLPVKYRLVIEVFDLNETSLSESYSALRISKSAAKTRLFRARRRLNLLLTQINKPPVNVGAKRVLA